MDIQLFFVVMAANIMANGLTAVYFYSLKHMQQANDDGRHPSWAAIIGVAFAPLVIAGSLFFFIA